MPHRLISPIVSHPSLGTLIGSFAKTLDRSNQNCKVADEGSCEC